MPLPLCHRHPGATASPVLCPVMGYLPPTACLWVLCHLLSHLPATEGDQRLSCGPHFCSTSSCCLHQWVESLEGKAWACGCPPGTAPIAQNSIISCQVLDPKVGSCKFPILEEARRACGDPKSPAGATTCARLLATQQLLDAACTQPTAAKLQNTLNQLQAEALKDLRSTTTELLLQSTEALVLQAALQRPGSGPQRFNTSTMEAAVEVVHSDGCPQTTLMLVVSEESLTISCQEVVSDAQAGKHAVAFIVYKEVEKLLGGTTELRQGRLNSRVVGGTMGTPNITFEVAFNITLQHHTAPQAGEEPHCMSWQKLGTENHWTPSGCTRIGGDNLRSVCACTHFSTFAILMAIHPVTESYALLVVTYVGMSVSLVCLFLAIITFLLCRSLWSISITLHLHLSICLFAADLLFLVAVPHTTNQLTCAITAGFLHYLFLACFAWMFLEGLHLFLTIRNLTVLNYTSASRFRKRYIYPAGYGTPAIVVAISAAVHPGGYGTEHYCWLSMKGGFIWSFLGPVCVIILVNLLFFLTTLWILRDKLSSLNADVTALKSTRLMTFKALAQICILGCTWGLGLLQAQGDNIVVAFIFTIVNSLQGAFIFLVHCVLNRQVTEQYRRWFRVLGQREHPHEMPTTEMQISYVMHGPFSPPGRGEAEQPQHQGLHVAEVTPGASRTDPFPAHPTHFQQFSSTSDPFPAYFLSFQPVFPVILLI
ncbi:adhesion G protein-coupled receptor E3 isoform X2 [Falco cherrug]|uniref:adhesion G protein-coupled receptor E3 isoform X2 n=1 Tax=Falco cherrug TaxID=345164 RepID=UPI00247AC213|nr:adhesion G protein-coupled receptor E3 isoform X2 [Falco cherrug]